MNKIKITPSQLFFMLYILISLATFRHSAVGFASLEGSLVWGALSALAVDVLMILFAHSIRQRGFSLKDRHSWALSFGLAVPALASIYTQLLFAVTEAQILEVAPGALWMNEYAVNITNVRVIGLPALLPILALVAALLGESDQEQNVPLAQYDALKTQLEQLRASSAKERLAAQGDVAELEQLRGENAKHQARLERLRSDEALKSASGLMRILYECVYNNGVAPLPKVFAEGFGVTEQTARKARSDAQPRLPGVNGE